VSISAPPPPPGGGGGAPAGSGAPLTGRALPETATRARIKQALADLLQDRSFFELTVADVLAQAEVSRASFYFNYSNLADLLGELARDAAAAIADAYAASAASAASAAETGQSEDGQGAASSDWIERAVAVGTAVWRDNAALLRAIVEVSAVDQSIRQAWTSQIEILNQIAMASAAQDQEAVRWLRGRDAETVVAAMTMVMERLVYAAARGEPPFDHEPTLVATLADIWSLSLRGRRARI
jgi:AcrR family transcriptional regulator